MDESSCVDVGVQISIDQRRETAAKQEEQTNWPGYVWKLKVTV